MQYTTNKTRAILAIVNECDGIVYILLLVGPSAQNDAPRAPKIKTHTIAITIAGGRSADLFGSIKDLFFLFCNKTITLTMIAANTGTRMYKNRAIIFGYRLKRDNYLHTNVVASNSNCFKCFNFLNVIEKLETY